MHHSATPFFGVASLPVRSCSTQAGSTQIAARKDPGLPVLRLMVCVFRDHHMHHQSGRRLPFVDYLRRYGAWIGLRTGHTPICDQRRCDGGAGGQRRFGCRRRSAARCWHRVRWNGLGVSARNGNSTLRRSVISRDDAVESQSSWCGYDLARPRLSNSARN